MKNVIALAAVLAFAAIGFACGPVQYSSNATVVTNTRTPTPAVTNTNTTINNNTNSNANRKPY